MQNSKVQETIWSLLIFMPRGVDHVRWLHPSSRNSLINTAKKLLSSRWAINLELKIIWWLIFIIFRSMLMSVKKLPYVMASHQCPPLFSSKRASKLIASREPMLRNLKNILFNTVHRHYRNWYDKHKIGFAFFECFTNTF